MAFCRNASRAYVDASAVVVKDIEDPSCLEALACREGIALAEYLNLKKVEIASDCLVVLTDK